MHASISKPKMLAQLTSLTLKMTTTQVVETSVTVNNNSPIQDYIHLDDQTQPTFEMTPGFKPFTIEMKLSNLFSPLHGYLVPPKSLVFCLGSREYFPDPHSASRHSCKEWWTLATCFTIY